MTSKQQIKYRLIAFFFVAIAVCEATLAQQAHEPIQPVPVYSNQHPERVKLGERLFHDARLSKDGTVSCASCHNLTTGGDDDRPVSIGVGQRKGDFNAPTVFNCVLNIRQFWDGRARDLFDQIEGPIHNGKEMASNWPFIVRQLQQDAELVAAFRKVFDDGITAKNIKTVIVAFEESLLTPDSRFDRYLRGQSDAITADELQGYRLFRQYGCISCHQGRLVGGNLFQKLGVMQDYFTDMENVREADLGRFNVTGQLQDRFVFKVPGLRNVAVTAPYLHDGSVDSLQKVVEIMMKYQLGVDAPEKDIALIVQFLKTLTGRYQGKDL